MHFMMHRLVEGSGCFGLGATRSTHAAIAFSFLETGMHETGASIHGGAVALWPKDAAVSFVTHVRGGFLA